MPITKHCNNCNRDLDSRGWELHTTKCTPENPFFGTRTKQPNNKTLTCPKCRQSIDVQGFVAHVKDCAEKGAGKICPKCHDPRPLTNGYHNHVKACDGTINEKRAMLHDQGGGRRPYKRGPYKKRSPIHEHTHAEYAALPVAPIGVAATPWGVKPLYDLKDPTFWLDGSEIL